MRLRLADHITPAQRSFNMSRVRSKNTTPELVVRKALWARGYRFRLHRNDLPGKPDIVLPSRRVAVFVHGCFWHRHPACRCASTPKTRTEFWTAKFARNVDRDEQAMTRLAELGWRTHVVWECETKRTGSFWPALSQLLESSPVYGLKRAGSRRRSMSTDVNTTD